MFGTIRKHQTWLWIFIIAVTILGMIFWQSNTGSGNRRAGGNFGSIDNKPITMTEMQQAQNDATLMYLVQTHQWPDSAGKDFDLQRQAYQRLFLLRKLNDYNIHADPDAAAQLANMILGQWEQGQPIPMDDFLKALKAKGLTAEDFEHFLETDIAIQQLESVIGLSGKMVTQEEIKSLFVEQYQELAADVVFFSASNYLARIPAPTAEALGHFYTNRQANYREPDKMQLTYVFYNVTNFMSQAEKQIGTTNLNSHVDEAMTRLGTNYLRLGKTAEEARTKVRELIVQDVAESNALNLANTLVRDVTAKQTNILENLAAVAKERGMEVRVTKPFDKEYGPGELNLGANYPVSSLFDLTPEDPLLPALRGVDGAYVLALNRFVPSRIPPLSEIRSQVEEDYKFEQALTIAKVNGQSFASTATNELAHGKTFAQTAEATRVTPVKLPPFSLATTRLPEVEEHVDLNAFKNVAFGTPVGGVSHFSETPAGGFVVHVRERLPLDEAKMKTQLPEFSNLVRQRRQTEAFNLWFSQEASKAMRDIPEMRRQQ